MQKYNGKLLFSATDLCNYLECPHLTNLSLIDLDTPLEKDAIDEEVELLQKMGLKHEQDYFEKLKSSNKSCINLSDIKGSYEEKFTTNVEALRKAPDVLFQSFLLKDSFIGYADFLIKNETASKLGDFSYEVLDTKLAKQAKPYYIIQLCLSSELLSNVQGITPEKIYVALGSGETESFYLKDYDKYFNQLKSQFLEHIQNRAETYPEPCSHCSMCAFKTRCQNQRIDDDHLSLVANMRKSQIKKLFSADITTLENLALTKLEAVKGIGFDTFKRLKKQAQLQYEKRISGEDKVHVFTKIKNNTGFFLLPEPDEGDLYFDIEGDPHYQDGLEYLFGLIAYNDNNEKFIDIWSYNHKEEKASFEKLIRYFIERLKKYPKMHIYHYASYEETALKRLMSKYGTMEKEVDHLLRQKVLVDLYKVVRHSIQVSEPAYSIKNLETFYMGKREAEVTSAGASILYFEKYLATGDKKYIKDLYDYNLDDCRSTVLLRDWLVGIRKKHQFELEELERDDFGTTDNPDIDKLLEFEKKLLTGLPLDEVDYSTEHKIRRLLFNLADFYRRQAKPQFWEMFSRQNMTTEELIDDNESIGGLTIYPKIPPELVKRSTVVTYKYPEQDFKLKEGGRPQIAETLKSAGTIEFLDPEEQIIKLKRANKSGPLPDSLDLVPGGPIDTKKLKEALWFFIEKYIEAIDNKERPYPHILDFLEKKLPNIKNIEPGQNLITKEIPDTDDYIKLAKKLDNSYLFIQGPPGTGKTYTASHLILSLIKDGKKIGVMANSHKVINNLLSAVEKRAEEDKFTFKGLKKTSFANADSDFDGVNIENSSKNEDVIDSLYDDVSLVAGTAWFFSSFYEPKLDYLFIDEAGQISLAYFISAAISAKNVILVGDQMQLAQPTQGVHPGESGLSVLDYLLQGRHTVPPHDGLLLSTTYRMHPSICTFISDAIYDGRIRSLDKLKNQKLQIENEEHISENGILCHLVDHEDSTQKSDEEAEHIKTLYDLLLKKKFYDQDNKEHPITFENILIVSPYNMQVNNLKRVLGKEARVGTVDKFQGQEAEVVIVSMATSNPDDIPRGMHFLFSQNRLNVSISRAKCLSILVSSPKLFSARCNQIEQMRLVNTLCWLREYSKI